MRIGERHAAKLRGETQYFTGIPCSHGHLSVRTVSSGTCCECAKLATRTRYKTNPELARSIVSNWKARNPHYMLGYERRKAKTDILWKLKRQLRSRLWDALNRRKKQGSSVALLDCSISELKAHLESQFKPGMTWANWSRTGWHIDHIKPLASFDLTDPAQLAKACHYSNLQPLWAKENISKSARILV